MEGLDRLHKIIEEMIEKQHIAGANLLIIKDGKELYYTDAGYADIDNGRMYKRDTIFRLYSLTKPVTASCAMLLAQRGELDLGMPLEEVLPGFKNVSVWENGRRVPAKRSVLVKDLLSMTSGLVYGGDVTSPASVETQKAFDNIIGGMYENRGYDTVGLANRLGECGLAFHPGESWCYGSSADVLGAVIELVSGKRFGEFVKSELLEPLEMADTDFYVPEEKRPRLASVYEETEDGLRLCATDNLGIMYTQELNPRFESGGAGLVSTIDDYSHFTTMLLQNGRYKDRQIISEAFVEYLTGGALTPWQLESMWRSWNGLLGYNYGNLMRVMQEPGMALYHTWKGEYGWDGWLGAYMCNSPANKLSLLISYQRIDSGTIEITRKIRNALAGIV